MRLLVSCKNCHRQFDASGKAIGETFHCHCGDVIKVSEPSMMDATVVRCSNCGGPREQGSVSCGYCSADFTLLEKDLNSMCPNCCARISDRAKFCHHCGDRIRIEKLVGEQTELRCPLEHENEICLNSRRLGEQKLGALECPQCAGLFVGNATFDQLCTRAVRVSLPKFEDKPSQPPRAQAGPMYRKCPYCSKIMSRRNYGKKSGVIIDCCAKHGIWFDDDELRRVLQFLHDGGARKRLPRYRSPNAPAPRSEQEHQDNTGAGPGYELPPMRPREPWNRPGAGDDILETISDGIFRLFNLH